MVTNHKNQISVQGVIWAEWRLDTIGGWETVGVEINSSDFENSSEGYRNGDKTTSWYEMQFAFMSGRGTAHVIFILRQLQKKYFTKNDEL